MSLSVPGILPAIFLWEFSGKQDKRQEVERSGGGGLICSVQAGFVLDCAVKKLGLQGRSREDGSSAVYVVCHGCLFL